MQRLKIQRKEEYGNMAYSIENMDNPFAKIHRVNWHILYSLLTSNIADALYELKIGESITLRVSAEIEKGE